MGLQQAGRAMSTGDAVIHTLRIPSWAWGRWQVRVALIVSLSAEFYGNKQQPLEANSRYMCVYPLLPKSSPG